MAYNNTKNIIVINGPNLNFLGKRNPKIYGNQTIDEIDKYILKHFNEENVKIVFWQSNHEGEIIDKIQEADMLTFDNGESMIFGIVLNPGAYGHYSYAIRDAIESIDLPVVEVHISDVNRREAFRKNLVLSDVCEKTIIGQGAMGYIEAIEHLI